MDAIDHLQLHLLGLSAAVVFVVVHIARDQSPRSGVCRLMTVCLSFKQTVDVLFLFLSSQIQVVHIDKSGAKWAIDFGAREKIAIGNKKHFARMEMSR